MKELLESSFEDTLSPPISWGFHLLFVCVFTFFLNMSQYYRTKELLELIDSLKQIMKTKKQKWNAQV